MSRPIPTFNWGQHGPQGEGEGPIQLALNPGMKNWCNAKGPEKGLAALSMHVETSTLSMKQRTLAPLRRCPYRIIATLRQAHASTAKQSSAMA
eukprot:1400081-Amphidinium_carterae.2